MRKEASVAIRVANTACLQYAKVTTVVVSVQVRREQLARPVLSGGWLALLAGQIHAHSHIGGRRKPTEEQHMRYDARSCI